MGREHTGSAIWVRKPKPIKDLNLARLHFPRLRGPLMIETLQMQYAMDGHVRPVLGERFMLLARLACHDRRTDHQFSQEQPSVRRRTGAGEREYVRRPVFAAITRIQAAAASVADAEYGQARGPARSQASRGP